MLQGQLSTVQVSQGTLQGELTVVVIKLQCLSILTNVYDPCSVAKELEQVKKEKADLETTIGTLMSRQ